MNPDEPIPYKLTTEAMLLDDIRILTANNAALQADLDRERARLDSARDREADLAARLSSVLEIHAALRAKYDAAKREIATLTEKIESQGLRPVGYFHRDF